MAAGPATIDLERREVAVDGSPAPALTKTEFQVLATLAARQGEAVSREELMLEVWGTAVVGRSRSLDFFVGQIRAKLGRAFRSRPCAASASGWRADVGPRAVGVLVLLSLIAVASLAVPLALSSADRRTSTLAVERGRQLTALADEAAVAGLPLQPVVDRYREVYGEPVLVVDADGRALAASGLRPEANAEVPAAAQRTLVDEPSSPWPGSCPGTPNRFSRPPRAYGATESSWEPW